jgi:cold shock protein
VVELIDDGRDRSDGFGYVKRAGLRSLKEGQAIEFELVSNRGKTAAENLRVR